MKVRHGNQLCLRNRDHAIDLCFALSIWLADGAFVLEQQEHVYTPYFGMMTEVDCFEDGLTSTS